MKISETSLPGVFVVEPKVWGDDRGYFLKVSVWIFRKRDEGVM